MLFGRIGFGILLVVSSAVHFDPRACVLDWPRFRGPNGTGISKDKQVPVQWSEHNGILWKTAIAGAGNSSPVVWGNRVFLQSASSDGRERLLLCLNASDGKMVWSRSVPGSMLRINPKNTLASSTPASDGERVYAVFWDGKALLVCAYDFTGTLIWKRELGTFVTQHGAGASPIVYKDRIILANDQDTSSVLLCLRAKTGEIIWQVPRPVFNAACYSAPFLLEKPGEPGELIVCSTAGISSYDPDTGRENWRWAWPFAGKPLRTVASPVYSRGLIFATSGDGGGDRHMVAVKIGGKGEIKLAWESKRTFPYVPTMLTWGEHLYWINDIGIAGCHLARTGESIWTERLGGNVTSSPVLIDGKIYAASEEGDVYVFLASPSFKLLAKNSIGEMVRASPAVSDNRLFIRGRDHLFCIGPAALGR